MTPKNTTKFTYIFIYFLLQQKKCSSSDLKLILLPFLKQIFNAWNFYLSITLVTLNKFDRLYFR